jgi:GntR family transcriptional regulator
VLIRVDTTSSLPLGDQVAASVRNALADGSVRAGDRLPPAREVAETLGIDLHTVLRGYHRLRDEGLVELRRGRGAIVTAAADNVRARLSQAIRDLVGQARHLAVPDEEVIDMVRQALVAGEQANTPPTVRHR